MDDDGAEGVTRRNDDLDLVRPLAVDALMPAETL